jgi:hypothetical protein
MQPVAPSSRVVVIADPGPADQLRHFRDKRGWSSIEFRLPQDFLTPFDMATLEGEARRRSMESLYSSLRGKVIVRLLVANLNPEHIRHAGEAPLKRVRREWEVIRRHTQLLLNDATDEGACYLTVIVTEEGEWRAEFRDDLAALVGDRSGPLDPASEPALMPRHRCYLMTRLLELGKSSVVHAREAWPELVAGLLDYVRLIESIDEGRAALQSPGLFAWRSVRFVAGLDSVQFERSVEEAFRLANERLLASPSRPLFPTQAVDIDGKPGPSCQRPELRDPAMVDAALIDRGLAAEFGKPSLWADLSADLATRVRTSLWSEQIAATTVVAGAAEPIQELGLRVSEAVDQPGALFPGPLGDLVTSHLDADPLAELRRREGVANRARARVEALLSTHEVAARSFLPVKERALIGLTVSMALCYALVMLALLAASWSGRPTTGWMLGGWLAIWGGGGVTAALTLGFLLQRWRLRQARIEIDAALHAWVLAQVQVRDAISGVLVRAQEVAKLRAQRASRNVLHHRLLKVQTILQNEMQPLGRGAVGGAATSFESEAPIVDCAVGAQVVSHRESGELATWVQQELIASFRKDWQALLVADTRKLGFLPTSGLLEVAAQHSERLIRGVTVWMRVRRLEDLTRHASHEESRQAWKESIGRAQVGKIESATRFFSVDLTARAPSSSRLFTLPECRNGIDDGIRCEPGVYRDVTRSDLGPGVLAFWFADLEIDPSLSHPDGAIRFRARDRDQLRAGA